jgi:phosphate transport system substrate-binding protein
MTRLIRALAFAGAAAVGWTGAADARDQIRIVGSSTVYPFATAVAEQFGAKYEFPTPVVESTGTGGGLKLFCGGVGEQHPDMTNASRRIKESEVQQCAGNGIEAITEVNIGYDGIVLANSRRGTRLKLTPRQVYMALAKRVPTAMGGTKPNAFRTWSEIDKSLPNVKIEVLGPPPTSGTRDAFVELVTDRGCQEFEAVTGLDEERRTAVCATMREDGAFIEAGENDNLIVQKLEANHDAFGIFGFSFLDQNLDQLQGSLINGAEPTFENIADGAYPVSRPLYFYVKNAHLDVIPGIKEYVAEFTSDAAIGEEGYLADKGLIPLPADELKKIRELALSFTPLTM